MASPTSTSTVIYFSFYIILFEAFSDRQYHMIYTFKAIFQMILSEPQILKTSLKTLEDTLQSSSSSSSCSKCQLKPRNSPLDLTLIGLFSSSESSSESNSSWRQRAMKLFEILFFAILTLGSKGDSSSPASNCSKSITFMIFRL